jgi:parallel beta-helix repeat protein
MSFRSILSTVLGISLLLVNFAQANDAPRFLAPPAFQGQRDFPYPKPHAGPSTAQPGCGDTITESTQLTQDLICPTTTGFALKIVGDHVSLAGNGHQIVAPQATAGLYIQGTSDSVEGLIVHGTAEYGIFAYDSPGVRIYGNNVSDNQVGIELYAEKTVMSGLQIFGNVARDNAVFGLRTAQDGNGAIVSPSIYLNDFSDSGSYGMYIQADRYELNGFSLNQLKNSLNGVYLKDGDFLIHDVAMSFEKIQKVELFVDSARSVEVSDVELGTLLEPSPTQEHIGMDLYRCSRFQISQWVSWNQDVGLKLDTEQGTPTAGTLIDIAFLRNTTAGILAVSYDGTGFGTIKMTNAYFDEPTTVPKIYDVYVEPGTVLGPNSTL